jgi:copper transport protein
MTAPAGARRARAGRCAGVALVAAGLLAASAPSALGHAALTGGAPPPGQRVEDAPARVVLRFSEPLRRELSDAVLRDSRGRRVSAELSLRGRRMVLAPRRGLARGAYRVEWRTVSTQDAHPLEGSFGFGVRAAPGAGAGSLEQSPLADGGWVRALAHGLLYAALLLFAGALLTRALLGRRWPGEEVDPAVPPALDPISPASDGSGVATLERPRAAVAPAPDSSGAARRADAVVADAGLATVALAALAAVADAADAANGLSVDGLRAYLLSGTPGIARVVLVGLAVAGLLLFRRSPRAAALAAVAALGCVVASGHANSADPRGLAIVADWVHLMAGAIWLGGAALVAATWAPELRDPAARARVTRDVLPAFGRIALPAFLAVVAAGTVNAIVELGAVRELWAGAYGRILLAKVLLVAGAAGAAWAHAYRRRNRSRPGVAAEPAGSASPAWPALRAEVTLGVGVVLLAGLLVAFPLPPRQLDAAGGAAAGLPACDPCPLPAPRADELSVAGSAGSQVVAAWIRRTPRGLTGTLRTLDSRGRPGRGRIEVPGGSARPCGAGCAAFRAPPGPALTVRVADRGRPYTAVLPAAWRRGGAPRALLERAERTMRSLRSVQEVEAVSSGPGMHAFTRYRLRAPDRLAFATGGGVRTVQIDRTQWLLVPGSPWARSAVPGGVPFRTRSWFRWTPYARAVRVLSRRPDRVELALADPATPVWIRLTVDPRTGRVLRERLTARARFIDRRFHGFDRPTRIEPPTGAARG